MLVKDNFDTVSLSVDTDPISYFTGNYEIVGTNSTTVIYRFLNEQNGIYKYTNGTLVRENDIAEYTYNFNVKVNGGVINRDKIFSLNRLRNNYYPTTNNNEVIEFLESDSYIMRNHLEYRNVLDNQINSGLVQSQENLTIDNKKYNIRDRIVMVGQFGTLIVHQDGYSDLVRNKFKEDLNEIVANTYKYLAVGDKGTILEIDKVTLDIVKLDLPIYENLNSIDIKSGKGIIVGDNGICLVSIDNGKTWTELDIDAVNNINSVKFIDTNRAILVGNNGVCKEIIFNATVNDISITNRPDLYSEMTILNDLNSVSKFNTDLNRFKFIGNDWIDIENNIGASNFSFDFLFKPMAVSGTQSLFTFLPEKTNSGNSLDLGVKIYLDNTRLKVILNSGPKTYITLDTGVDVSDNKWSHVMFTRLKNEYKVFVNNNLTNYTDLGILGSFKSFNDVIRLGANLEYTDGNSPQFNVNASEHFIGVIDNVRIWSENLDDNEVDTNFLKYYNAPKLSALYKFNLIDDDNRIPTSSVYSNKSLILPPNSNLTTYNSIGGVNMIDNELFGGFMITGKDIITIILDPYKNYTNITYNRQFIIDMPFGISKLISNSSDGFIYGSGDKLFRFKNSLELDTFNFINNYTLKYEILVDSSHNDILLKNLELFLIGDSNKDVGKLPLESICAIPEYNYLDYTTGIIANIPKMGLLNGIKVENDYRTDFTSSSTNYIEYVKTLGYPSTQSVIVADLLDNTTPIEPYTTGYLYFIVDECINGSFEISLGGDFTEVSEIGEHFIPMVVGMTSKLIVRAKLTDYPIGNKIKGKLRDFTFYSASIPTNKTYSGGENVQKLYFPQFDTKEQLENLPNALYSYIDVKSLKIDGSENIGNFSPKYLYKPQFDSNTSVNCQLGNLCDFNGIDRPTTDRLQYGLQLDIVNDEYVYDIPSYGLLESFVFNGVQIFGMDRDYISDGSDNINSPFYMGIDFEKDFYFEVESMILSESDLLNIGMTDSRVNIGATISNTTPTGNHFNQLYFEDNTPTSYSMSVSLLEGYTYYMEFELESGSITINIGTDTYTFTNSFNLIKEVFIAPETISNITISLSGTASALINNFVITDRIPTVNTIEWNPLTCELSYKLNGVVYKSFLQEDGSGQYVPECSSTLCTNVPETIIDDVFWSKYKPKLLFTDYDVANKLYFFDIDSGEYNLPTSIEISNVKEFNINSISGQSSWLDYHRDATKSFELYTSKTDANTIEYSTRFRLADVASSTVVLNSNSSSSIDDINDISYGLLPNYIDSITIGTPSVSKDYYFYDGYAILKNTIFNSELGDVILISNSVINGNGMVIKKVEIGVDTYTYIQTNFDNSINNRLANFTKNTTITNLNLFENQSQMVSNFNNHPISNGYKLIDNGVSTTIEALFNHNTAYYNLQASIAITDPLDNVKTSQMIYGNNILSFKYGASYNILDILDLDSEFEIPSMPDFRFPNQNSGVLYDISSGILSFHSDLYHEWLTFDKYLFVDIIFDNVTLSSNLIISKYYEASSDRYILQTYKYYKHNYNMSDLGSTNIRIRVRNKLGEISSDLNKMNNIQKGKIPKYFITDFNNNTSTIYNTYDNELNFKPSTDNYVKYLLSVKEVKDYLSAIIFTNHNNEMAVNIINLPTRNDLVIKGVDKSLTDCELCVYDDYTPFYNPALVGFNQISLVGSNTLFTNRLPFEQYGYNNQINVSGFTASSIKDIDIEYVPDSGQTRVLEFNVSSIKNITIDIFKSNAIIDTISVNGNYKISFTDTSINDLFMRINISDNNNRVIINDIHVGNSNCLEDCYDTILNIDNHGLFIGDGFIVDIGDDIYSSIEQNFSNDWVLATQSGTSSISGIGLTISGTSSIYTEFSLTEGKLYRTTFDYTLTGTSSFSLAIGENGLDTIINNIEANSLYRAETNFIAPTASTTIGFIADTGYLSIDNFKLEELTNQGQYYDGYQVVKNVIDENTIVITIPHNGSIEKISATYSSVNKCGDAIVLSEDVSNYGTASKYYFDPYLNYEPIDLFKLGYDDKIDRSILISPNNWVNNGRTIYLDNIDLNKFRFKMVDQLSLDYINDNFSWVLEAEVRNATIGKDTNGKLVWYSGSWDCGRWFNGTWHSGTWYDGEWYDGTWNNNLVNGTEVSSNSSTITSVWNGGNFRGGVWNNGVWNNGVFKNSIWNNGSFNGGMFESGTWNNGTFNRGSWVSGTWNNGTFNSRYGTSYWFDGEFNGGDFNSGYWYGGTFADSKFGYGSTISRKALWENGSMISSSIGGGNDTTFIKTGNISDTTINSGTLYSVNMDGGIHNNGVIKDISVIAVSIKSSEFKIIVRGEYEFKLNDTFHIINNRVNPDILGSDTSIYKYKLDRDAYIEDGNTVLLVTDIPSTLLSYININGDYTIGYDNEGNIIGDTITKVVSKLTNVEWYNGRFENGIFDGKFFRNGMFINGAFISGHFGF